MGKNLTQEERENYIRIANYYYRYGYTQEEIAKKANTTRQRINRILSKCVELGIVKFEIPDLQNTNMELESRLEEKYGIITARVVTPQTDELLYSELGKASAKALSDYISNNDTIGLSRGRGVSAFVDHFPNKFFDDLKVAQLMGGWNSDDFKTTPSDIVRRFSEKTNASITMLHAPVIVSSPELKNSFLKEDYTLSAFNVIKNTTIAIVGIGGTKYSENLSNIEKHEYSKLVKQGAIGEICTNFFDIDGKQVLSELDNRTIAITYQDFLKIPTRVGIAGSTANESKYEAILGALKGGLINVLITDVVTAEKLISM